MSLTSLIFFAAFVISLIVYYIVPKRMQWILLLIYSVLFLAVSSSPLTLIYFAASVIVTTVCVKVIEKGKSKFALAVGIILNIGILAVLKYHYFFITNANAILNSLHIGTQLPDFQIEPAAPIGISFYTMMIIAYLLDTYWGVTSAEKGLFRNALFIGYWPLLTSGPIVRHEQMKEELFAEHTLDPEEIAAGLQRMLWGVFKKIVISARLGVMVDTIYSNISQYQGLYLILAMGMFLLQLYTDFSGCMDIIIGASQCYGIKLPENFNHPFRARSVQEYWQRWHITLGLWLRDYVMYPLLRTGWMRKLNSALKKRFGRKAAGQVTTYLGMLAVWLLIGLWHGGDWKYILGMGLWFYACIVLGELLKPLFGRIIKLLRINTETAGWHLFQSCRVFVLAAIGNVYFRLPSVKVAHEVFKRSVAVWNPWVLFDGSLYQLGLSEKNCRLLVICLLILVIVEFIQQKESMRVVIRRQNLVFRWGIWLMLITAIAVFGMYGPGYDVSGFIYQKF